MSVGISLSLSLSLLSLTIITQALQKGNPTSLQEAFGAQEFLILENTSVACAADGQVRTGRVVLLSITGHSFSGLGLGFRSSPSHSVHLLSEWGLKMKSRALPAAPTDPCASFSKSMGVKCSSLLSWSWCSF